jgi:hypothetical protein
LEYYGPRQTTVSVILPAKVVDLLKRHVRDNDISIEDAQKIDELVSNYSFEYYVGDKKRQVTGKKDE